MLNATMLPDAMPVIRVLETWRTESGLNQFRICCYSLSLRVKRGLELSRLTISSVNSPIVAAEGNMHNENLQFYIILSELTQISA